MRRIHRSGHRPEAEKENDDPEQDGEDIDKRASNSRDAEGPPDESVGVSRVDTGLVGQLDRSGDSTPEKEALGDDIRGVKTTDAERNDIVESSGRTEIDETN